MWGKKREGWLPIFSTANVCQVIQYTKTVKHTLAYTVFIATQNCDLMELWFSATEIFQI